MDISKQIEAILFWKAEPLGYDKLANILATDIDNVKKSIDILEEKLKERGIQIVKMNDAVMLGTSKDCSPIIEAMMKEELSKDLGRSGGETLTIILYLGPISRSEIDHIRGVNSQFIIRNLLIRGLIERIENPKDARVFLYKPTLNLIASLGLSKIEDLPDYVKTKGELDALRATNVETGADKTIKIPVQESNE